MTIAGRVVGVMRRSSRNPITGRPGTITDQSLREIYLIERWPDGSVAWIEEGAYVWMVGDGTIRLTMRTGDPDCSRDVPFQQVYGWEGKAIV